MSQPGHYKETYDEYVLKFKPKRTKDDTYTPEPVYNALRDYVVKYYGLEGRTIVRPFWPGADFRTCEYPDNCVVIDNPPFSIQNKITDWFVSKGIDFFLFANHLTILHNWKKGSVNVVITANNLIFENGAVLPISFITSLGDNTILINGELRNILLAANKQEPKTKKQIEWPADMMSGAMLQKYAKLGRICPIDGDLVHYYKKHHIFGGGIRLTPESVENLRRLESGDPVLPVPAYSAVPSKVRTLDQYCEEGSL